MGRGLLAIRDTRTTLGRAPHSHSGTSQGRAIAGIGVVR